MSLIPVAAVTAKLNEQLLLLMMPTEPRSEAAPCYAAKMDFVDAFKPLLNWAFGNVRGIAPWIAAGISILLGTIILLKVMGRDDVSTWVKAVGWVFVGLAIVLFVPAVIFTVADTAPAGGSC